MENRERLNFIVAMEGKSWFTFDRRPHFADFAKFGNLIVVEQPLVFGSRNFIKNPLRSLKNYWKYTKGIRVDPRSKAKIIRPILLFPAELKNKFKILKNIDQFLYNNSLSKVLKKNNKTVFCFTSYLQDWLFQENKYDANLLDFYDEWSMIKYADSKSTKAVENRLRNFINKMDLVVSTTKQLMIKYNERNNFIYLPNAVDTSHFVPKFDKLSEKVPENLVNKDNNLRYIERGEKDLSQYNTSLKSLPDEKNDVVGTLSGLSGNWSDFKMMKGIEELLPTEIILYASGNIHKPKNSKFWDEFDEYAHNPRTKYLQYLDYSILPDYLEYLKVGLILNRMDDFNKHSAPNKIWAYLAMGVPVVSTNFLYEHDKEIFEGLVNFVDTPNEFVSAILHELKNDSPELRNKRRNLALKHSTYNRTKTIINRLVANTFNSNIEIDDIKNKKDIKNVLESN